MAARRRTTRRRKGSGEGAWIAAGTAVTALAIAMHPALTLCVLGMIVAGIAGVYAIMHHPRTGTTTVRASATARQQRERQQQEQQRRQRDAAARKAEEDLARWAARPISLAAAAKIARQANGTPAPPRLRKGRELPPNDPHEAGGDEVEAGDLPPGYERVESEFGYQVRKVA